VTRRVDGELPHRTGKPFSGAGRQAGGSKGGPVNVFDHLIKEHDQAKQLMEQLKEKPRKRDFEQLKQALEQHIGGEEKVVYKAMDKHPELHAHVLESIEEHRVVKRLLNEISRLEPREEKWQAKFKVLKEAVEHHVEEEEGSIFPEARELMDGEKAEELDSKYSEAEKRLAA
jgi:RNA binding exosome subunit